MNIVSIQFNGVEPLYIQLSREIQRQIYEHKPKKGCKLPPIRQLAGQLAINNGTVVRAYKDLEQKGFVQARVGSGYHIIRHTDAMERVDLKEIPYGEREDLHKQQMNFASATPNPSMFPVETFKECLNYVLERDQGYAFEYQEGSGYLPLRESLCAYFLQEKSIHIEPEDVVIVSGAQQGIDMIAKTYLQEGDFVLTENPTYTGAVRIFESRGAKVVGIPMDREGMQILALESAIIQNRPKLLYMMSRYQNPTTVCYSKHKIKQILALAKKYNFFIIEDDSLSELSYRKEEKDEISQLMYGHEKVITIKSFSKLLMPGLRIGFLILPHTEVPPVLQAKYVTDISTSGFIQRTVDIYFRSGRWAAHLEGMKARYEENYQVMKCALISLRELGVSYTDPQGGVFFWLKLPKQILVYELQRRCIAKNVQFAAGYFFSLKTDGGDESLTDYAVRLSFAAVQPSEIEAGIAVIRSCMEEMSEERRRENYSLPWV